MVYSVPMGQLPASAPGRIAVLLVNLGTPDSPSYFAVQRYLREFLSDRRVIDASRLFWLPCGARSACRARHLTTISRCAA